MRIFTALLLFFAGSTLAAQTNLSTGGAAPKINVTDWLLNEPADKDLTAKFIVLEFWATWCGPCIAAIPHLNELQAKFDRPDLYFISLTDESTTKVSQSLDRLNFNSIVATDVSKQTQIAFGDGKKGLEAFPMTVLISPAGNVIWVGEPKQLTEKVMNAFLNGSLPPQNRLKELQSADNSAGAPQTDNAPSPTAHFIKRYKDPDLLYTFELNRTNSRTPDWLIMHSHAIFYGSVTLSELYRDAFNTTIYDSYDLDTISYQLTYIDKSKDSLNMTRVEETVRRTLGLRKESFSKKITTYTAKVADRTKLVPTLEKRFSTRSSSDGVFVFKNITIKDMLKAVGDEMKTSLYSLDQDDGKYDFNIAIDSLEHMLGSLKGYGFRTTGKLTEIKAIKLVKAK